MNHQREEELHPDDVLLGPDACVNEIFQVEQQVVHVACAGERKKN
jgi:hypothetical protein